MSREALGLLRTREHRLSLELDLCRIIQEQCALVLSQVQNYLNNSGGPSVESSASHGLGWIGFFLFYCEKRAFNIKIHN